VGQFLFSGFVGTHDGWMLQDRCDALMLISTSRGGAPAGISTRA
jgi:hypothetical protein